MDKHSSVAQSFHFAWSCRALCCYRPVRQRREEDEVCCRGSNCDGCRVTLAEASTPMYASCTAAIGSVASVAPLIAWAAVADGSSSEKPQLQLV